MIHEPNADAIRLDGADGERVGASAKIPERKPADETFREEGSAFRALVEQSPVSTLSPRTERWLTSIRTSRGCWAMSPRDPSAPGGNSICLFCIGDPTVREVDRGLPQVFILTLIAAANAWARA